MKRMRVGVATSRLQAAATATAGVCNNWLQAATTATAAVA